MSVCYSTSQIHEISTSPGGFTVFEELYKAMSGVTGMAFIIVQRHSSDFNILTHRPAMPVQRVENGIDPGSGRHPME